MKLLFGLFLSLFLTLLNLSKLNAQVFQIGIGFGTYGEIDGNSGAQCLGVGEFTVNGDEPQAALDVRVPFLIPSGLPFDPAETFQTTSEGDYGAVWRMFTGKETWAREEKFHIRNPNANSLDIQLNVVNDGNMDFFTTDMHWMRLSPQLNYGYLGLNDFDNTGPWDPHSNIHLNRLSADEDVFAQFTNESTGYVNNTQGFKLGIHKDSYSGKTFAELRQYVDAPIVISSSTITSNPSTLTERMRITYGTGGPSSLSNMTKVSISYGNSFNPIRDPLAMLNLGEGINIASLGNRTWMEVGTHMVRQSDQMYVGIKDEGSDFGCAVINWGDNPTNGDPYGPDMLKFIFTGSYSGGSSVAKNSYDGLEVARMTATGNMGIGSGWNNTNILPKRRLDLIDNAASGGGGSNYPDHISGPQLRLTHTASTTLTGGLYTDFETNSSGNLIITPFSSAVEKSVGIHESSPLTTFHVGGTPGTSGAITSDYLNHSSTPSAPGSSPYLVYSDANGTLKNLPPAGNSSHILHGDGTWGPGGTGGGNVSSCSGTLTNYIPVFDASSNICKSDLYNTAGKRVGMNTITPAAAFHSIADASDASLIAANSSGNYAIFANFDNHVSIGANTTFGTGGGLASRLWVRGLTPAGSITPANGLTITNSSDSVYFETNDDGKILIGRHFYNHGSGPEGRVAINYGAVDNFVNLKVRSSYNTDTTGNNERAFMAQNSSYADLITCWADEHVTMGIGGLPSTTNNQNDARLVVNALNNTRAAYFAGDIFYNNAWQSSDSTLKKNIQPVQNALQLVSALEAKTYEFDQNSARDMSLPAGNHFGYLAQDVKRLLPNLVSEHMSPGKYDSLGNETIPGREFLAMNYIEIIPLLTQAIKEQQAIIDSLSSRDSLILAKIDQLQDAVSSCCSGTAQRVSSEKNSIDVELTSENAIILNQNDPNPFSERTRISYKIPESVKKAEVIFYTSKGVILKSVVIASRGEGEMNIFASDLSSGIYMYSLIADGKTIDSKKMICTK